MHASEDNGGPSAALTGTIPSARARLPFSEYSFVGGGPDLAFIALATDPALLITTPARDIVEPTAPPVPDSGDIELPPPSAAADQEPEAPMEAALPVEPLPEAVALPTFDELFSRARGRFVLDDAVGPDFMPLPEKMIPVFYRPESGDLLPIDPLFGG